MFYPEYVPRAPTLLVEMCQDLIFQDEIYYNPTCVDLTPQRRVSVFTNDEDDGVLQLLVEFQRCYGGEFY